MSSKKHEDEYLNNIKKACGNDDTLHRHYHSLMWYIKSARRFKFMYYCFNIIAIIAPIIGTTLTIWFDEKWLSIISSVGTLSVSLLSLFQCQKHWRLYRSTAEKMKSLFENLFNNNIEQREFVTLMSDLLNSENKTWIETIMNKDKT